MNRAAPVLTWLLIGLAVGVAFHVGERRAATEADADTGAGARPLATIGAPLDALPMAGRTGESATGAPPHSYHEGIMRAAPSVVSLYASIDERGDASGDLPADGTGRRRLSQGSGVVVDPDGIVLTNLHLVEGADAINVVLADGTLHVGRLVGSDRETDLAVVRIDASGLPDGGLAAVPLGDAPSLRVGDVVLAIGNPFGVGQTVTQGIVSATRRRVAGGSAWQDFVQIDAAINPGNSGGALINPAGQLVGVTTAVFRGGTSGEGPAGFALAGEEGVAPPRGSRGRPGVAAGGRAVAEGIGFAIPAELLARVVPEIIRDGRVVRGWLGIDVDDLPMYPELHRRLGRGAVITAVMQDGPAAEGGLNTHDVVTGVDGRSIADATALLLLVSSLDPGTEIRLDVTRGGTRRTVPVTLGERPPPDAATIR